MRRWLKRVSLQAMYYSGLYRLISERYAGIGTILLTHKVVSEKADCLATQLTITVHFLDRVIAQLKPIADFVTLDEVLRRLTCEDSPAAERPFIALTFDDGFRDNLTLALPILRRHGVPATIYVSSGAPDRSMDAWPWRLEKAICLLSALSIDLPGLPRSMSLQTLNQKRAAFRMLTRYIHENIRVNREIAELLLPRARVSDESLIAEQFANWDELRQLAADPLVSIGAHGVTHASLRDLDEDQVMFELVQGREHLSSELDVAVTHLAYPYGESSDCGPREFALAERAGFLTGVTTRIGNIFYEHRDKLMCLPRIGLGGVREETSLVKLDVSGTPVALSRRWRNPVVSV